ncbi:hypothetical protein Pla110_18610 [Polystyrenella longa]|uniref:Uncharacterized protein n=1 Tax=Polystyrenella longa TaxID=2528007 RepID=A0A518CLN1_9PLAN|nr:hypothetical protein [Polystyrenella longa]QDU80138.1 hypothetical protein Pla110_18610 [Polystyrenella longa]
MPSLFKSAICLFIITLLSCGSFPSEAQAGKRSSRSNNKFLGNFDSLIKRSPHYPKRRSHTGRVNTGEGKILGHVVIPGVTGNSHPPRKHHEGFDPRPTNINIWDNIASGIERHKDRREQYIERSRPPIEVQPQPQYIPQTHVVQTPVRRNVSVQSNTIPKAKMPLARANSQPGIDLFEPIDAESQELATELVHAQTGKAINEMEDQLGDAAQDPAVAEQLEEIRAKAENGEAVTEEDINELVNRLEAVDPAQFPPGFTPDALISSFDDVINLSEANELLQDQTYPDGGFVPGLPVGQILTMPALPQDMQFMLPDGCALVGTGGEGELQVYDPGTCDMLNMNLGMGEPEIESTDDSIAIGIIIQNPEENGEGVNYQVEGVNYTLQPGENQQLPVNHSQVIVFESGIEAGELRFTIKPGNYAFRQLGAQGWKLWRESFEVTIDNSENTDIFYVTLNEEQIDIPSGQQMTYTSQYPVTALFDRGNGGEPARKQLNDAKTALVVAVNTNDGLLDLYPETNFNIVSSKTESQDILKQTMLKGRLQEILKQQSL